MTSVWVAEHGWVYLMAAIDCCTLAIARTSAPYVAEVVLAHAKDVRAKGRTRDQPRASRTE